MMIVTTRTTVNVVVGGGGIGVSRVESSGGGGVVGAVQLPRRGGRSIVMHTSSIMTRSGVQNTPHRHRIPHACSGIRSTGRGSRVDRRAHHRIEERARLVHQGRSGHCRAANGRGG